MPNKAIGLDRLKDYDKKLKDLACLWNKQTQYSLNDVVSFNGTKLKCTTAGTSGSTTLDLSDVVDNELTDGTVVWELLEEVVSGSGIEEWEQNTSYAQDQLLLYDDIIYKVDSDFTSGSTFDDADLVALTHKHSTTEQIQSLFI